MKTADLTVVETQGGLVARAQQLGEAVRSNYAATAGRFEPRRALLETAQGKQVFENVRARYVRDCADILPHMEAFARGLGVALDSVLEVNILVALAKSRLEGCTGFIITRGGRTVTAQNWDTGESAAPMAVLEIGRGGEGLDTARFTSPLTLDFWAGVNPYGLAMGGCSGPAGDPIGTGEGITCTLWRGPLFYACKNVEGVRERVSTIPMPGKGANAVFVDATGAMLWTQQGGGRFGMVTPATSYCAATGYRVILSEASTPKEKAEHDRWKRFMHLAEKAVGSDADLVDCVKHIVADHCVVDGHPASSPCRHGGPESSTQFSLIFDLTSREVHYCGRPCENEWRRITLG